MAAVLAQTSAAIRGERGRNLAELRIAVDVAVGRGDRGEIRSKDFSAEMLLRRSPRVAGQIKARVYGPLNEELARTLDLLAGYLLTATRLAEPASMHGSAVGSQLPVAGLV